ncbi:MAG: hypothetical protein JWR67_382 [Mucilaginibacter sp.]|nr:hypothetical protein [Mucilaginibacter sp.]
MKIKLKKFPTENVLIELIDIYFKHIEGENNAGENMVKTNALTESSEKKPRERQSEPATIAGLALYLGFNSRDEFEDYETRGKFKHIIKRARLRVEAAYEKKLHQSSSTGAIFALKNLGWNEKTESKTPVKIPTTLKVKIIESGPIPASNEKEVVL